jgi:hypothetical protein
VSSAQKKICIAKEREKYINHISIEMHHTLSRTQSKYMWRHSMNIPWLSGLQQSIK